jgi:RNA polymerase sigma-70 factor (ECF subfamily)
MITVTLDSASYPAETLLGHQEFVRNLARSLVRDKDAALDVAQDAWLEALRRTPRSIESMQAWLGAIVRNRAHNRRRENQRRAAREEASARHEADESDESDEILRDRVALAHEVVQAVLSLREPYRAIVILRYYENLSPRQIAARKRVPGSTVRVQLGRAHEMLRAKLDALRDGDRASWSVALSALAGKPAAEISALKVAAIAAGCAAAVGIPLWLLRLEPPAPSPILAEIVPEPRAVAPVESSIAEENSLASADAREPIAQAAATPDSIDPELASKSVRELLELAVQTQRTIRKKLLTPDERFVHEQARLLEMPSTGLARILEHGKFGTDDSNALGIPGGGSCYSFATRGHGWGDEPDLDLDKGALRVQGGQSYLLDLGDLRLEALPDSIAPAPADLDEVQRAAWEWMWTDAHTTERGVDSEFLKERRRFPRTAAPKIGRAYLLRAINPLGHDLLVGFTVLQQDEVGSTIAWRILHAWPMASRWNPGNDPYWWVADPPEAMSTREVDSLVSSLDRIRAAARAKLLTVPAEVTAHFAEVLALPQTGVARLLTYQRYQALVEAGDGGAHFSFTTGANTSGLAADIGLGVWGYEHACFGPNCGYLLDLGAIPIESVGEALGPPPPGLSQRDKERWSFLMTLPSPEKGKRTRPLGRDDEVRARQCEFPIGVRPEVGHACLVRSIVAGDHDVLAVFTTAAVDEAGAWIVWRMLWNRSLVDESSPR